MFGMGGSEILVILIVALLFLGPEKLPDAATKISKGIRDLRRQTRELTQTIENDTEIGGAIRDIKSALRGDEPRARIQPRPAKKEPPKPAPDKPDPPDVLDKPADPALAGAVVAAAVTPAVAAKVAPSPDDPEPQPADQVAAVLAEVRRKSKVRLPETVGERDDDAPAAADGADESDHDDDDLAGLVRPPSGTVAKGADEPKAS